MAFDESLRQRDSRWGLRQLKDVVALAESLGLHQEAVHSMPVNKLTVVLRNMGKRREKTDPLPFGQLLSIVHASDRVHG